VQTLTSCLASVFGHLDMYGASQKNRATWNRIYREIANDLLLNDTYWIPAKTLDI
jgi:hypothetical protein